MDKETDREVMCDGPKDNPALGHPRIYLYIKVDRIECPYCGNVFTYPQKKDKKNGKA